MKVIETTGFVRPKFEKISTGVNHYCITILSNLQNVATAYQGARVYGVEQLHC